MIERAREIARGLHPDKRYLEFRREQYEEKKAFLQRLYERYFPQKSGRETKTKTALHDGFFFFPEIQPATYHGETFSDLYKAAQMKPPEKAAEAKEIFALEYKIHLMPKPEYTPAILAELFSALQRDPDLRDSITQIKVINDDKREREEVLPIIVIYTQLGKDNAQKALERVYAHLHRFEAVGNGETPRYNKKIDNLIFYAQGSGGWKGNYKRRVERDGKKIEDEGILDPDLIHFTGDYKLEIPDNVPTREAAQSTKKDRELERSIVLEKTKRMIEALLEKIKKL